MDQNSKKIAVIGMACRFPGANSIDQYWANLLEGKDTIKRFSDEELSKYEFRHDELINNPDFVRARGILDNVDRFDAHFFGMTPRESAFTDPQHRVWLETAWEAFENAGLDPSNFQGAIGVFAGGCSNTYLLNNILRDSARLENYIRLRRSDSFQIFTGNDVSFIPTKTAYHFNLKGPAVNVQTTCSTSLVAISMACQSLYDLNSDVCLAGAICIMIPQETGYIFQEGAIHSPDGYVHPFDARARGTVFSNGVGIVVLKRLDDAIRDHDNIYAVVRGWAVNNDGNNKISYTAPSIDGQSEVIRMAHSFAGISPEDVDYIETHGTGTQLGDPIEISALKKAFSVETTKKQFCGIGSVKSNIGHTDVAAGVASFIKACLISHNRKIPALINFSEPNPLIDFENSPFYVQRELRELNDDKPLIIGVSSFGIGGTNAHVIIGEAPAVIHDPVVFKSTINECNWPHLLPLSAKSHSSLDSCKKNILDYFEKNPDLNPEDVAYTLQKGRQHMAYRTFTVVKNIKDLTVGSFADEYESSGQLSGIVFMFPGQGAQYTGMGKDLYYSNSNFRRIVDECFNIVKSETGYDLKEILYGNPGSESSERRLAITEITQPAIFIIEYALAKLYEELGIKPKYLIGHSIGEYVAACISGVFDLDSALKIVIKRASLMNGMPSGRMMAVRGSMEKLVNLKSLEFEVAADNSDNQCTISYKRENADAVTSVLDKNEIKYIPLNASHGFHSSAFDPVLQEFASYVDNFVLKAPGIPLISCLTGDFITPGDAMSGNYWARQLRNTVRFRQGISAIANREDVLFLEVGPETHLTGLARQNSDVGNKKAVVTSLGKNDGVNENDKIIGSLGAIWANGIHPDFDLLHYGSNPRKIVLPSYPFLRERHWIDHVPGSVMEKVERTPSEPLPVFKPDETPQKIEMKIAAIWEELLGIKGIRVTDNFFFLGGHSLLALQVINRINEEFNSGITLENFFKFPTISGLISNGTFRSEFRESVHVTNNTDYSLPQPLSPAQERLWIINQIENNNPSYNISFSYFFEGTLDRKIFQESLEELFERHKILKSYIRTMNGSPSVVINPGFKIYISEMDFSGFSGIDQDNKVQEFIKNESRTKFSVEDSSLYRITLINLGKERILFNFTIHHLIFDGWSWGVFTKELKETYNSLLKGEKAKLEPLPIDYFEFARLAREEKKEKSLEEYWRNKLNGITGQLNFPLDFKRHEISTGEGGRVALDIGKERTAKLREYAKKENVTLYMLFLSVFGFLLSRYSGDKDICLGSPTANRPVSKLEKLIGLFINSIVLRLQIDEEISFSGFLNKVKNVTIEALSNQGLPFENLVDILQPERILNMNPIFQVMFAWQNAPRPPLELSGIKSSRVFQENGVSPLDITLYAWEEEENIVGEIEFSTDILESGTIKSLRGKFISLLDNILSNPETSLKNISILSDDDKKLIENINNTITPYPKNKTIVQLFEDQVTRYPDKTAVAFNKDLLTYKQLNERANQLARTLRESGVKSDTPVGILVEKSLDLIVGILGILKAGGGYVPIEPEYPVQRINFFIEDSGCKVLLTQDKFIDMRVEGARIINLNSKKSYHLDKSNVDRINDSSSLAYIMYTSGTTGKPKGSMIQQYSVVRLIRNTNYIELTADDRILLTGAIGFDATTFEIWGALLNGGTLYLAEKETIINPKTLGEELRKNGITVLWLTSPLFTMIAESQTDIFNKLKYLLSGGDVLSASHINKVRKDNPQLKIINAYGPTENTTFSTTYLIERDFDRNIPIGKPISNSTAYILDSNMNYQPVGVIGELYVGGDGLSKGYLNHEDLNRKSFLDHPFIPGEKIYRTGDYARLLMDGNIEFHGRIDNQLKVRGFRVELGEVESVISEMDGIIDVVIKPIKIKEGDTRLAAFLNVSDAFNMDTKELKKRIKEKLPPQMIPSMFKLMQEFPKTVNGKIDKDALKVDISAIGIEEPEENGQLTPTEKKIYDIWCKTLLTKDILKTDNFFDVGGTSLLAASVLSKLESQFKINLRLKTIFDNPRLKDLADFIDGSLTVLSKK